MSAPRTQQFGAVLAALLMATSVVALGGVTAASPGPDSTESEAISGTTLATENFSIQHAPISTTSDGLNTTKQVAITPSENLTLDHGANYEFQVVNVDTNESVTLAPNGTLAVEADSSFTFWLYGGDGTPRSNPAIGSVGDTVPAEVVDGAIPTDTGLTNLSVRVLNATSGETIDQTQVAPGVIGYQGALDQNGTSGTVELTIPQDTVPADTSVFLRLSKDNLSEGAVYDFQMTLENGSFRSVIDASNFSDGDYAWATDFWWQGVQITGVSSHFSVTQNITLESGSTADEIPPTVSSAQATDLTDGNGRVTDGDTVEVTATAADNETGIESVVANASAFGNDSVVLTDPDGDDVYNGSFVVDGAHAAENGSYPITVVATDGAGNTNATHTNELQLNTSGDQTAPEITEYRVHAFPDGESSAMQLVIEFTSSEQLEEIAVEVTDENGSLIHTFRTDSERADFFESGTGPYRYENFTADMDALGITRPGNYTFTVVAANDSNGNNGGGDAATLRFVVEDVTVEHGGGTEPELANLTHNVWLASGVLQVQLRDETGTDLMSRSELADVGVAADTTFAINITVVGWWTPRVLLGAGQNSTWNVTADGTTAVNITTQPADVQLNQSKLDDPSQPWSANEHADVEMNQSIELAVDRMAHASPDRRDAFTGTMLMTDAQEFGSPHYDAANETLVLFVGAPHLATDGNVNEGYFDAFVPNAVLDEWGVSDPAEITVTAMGETTEPASSEVTDEGIRLFVPMTYSSGAVTLSPEGSTAAASGPIEQFPGTTTSDGFNTSRQVTIHSDADLVFDNGSNYHLELANDETGDSVTVAVDGSFTLTENDSLAFLFYNATGMPDPTPEVWYLNRSAGSPRVNVSVLSGEIPAAAGTTNFSVTVYDVENGTVVGETASRPGTVGYSGTLTQNSTTGTVRLSVPRDVVPERSTVEVTLSEREGSGIHEAELTYDAATDAFATTVDADNVSDGDYAWAVRYAVGGWQHLRLDSHFMEKGNVTFGKTTVSSSEIDSCVVIDEPGAYSLTGSFSSGTAGACIEITSSDVILDGQGHSVTMTGSGEAVNVTSAGSITNVTVQNLVVVGGEKGLAVHAPAEDAVVDVKFLDNVIEGPTDGIVVTAGGNQTSLTVDISGNWITNTSDDGIDVEADGDRASVAAQIAGNYLETANDGIEDIDANGFNQTIDVLVLRNEIIAGQDGIDDIDADGDNATANIVVAGNVFETGDEGIEDIDVDGDNSTIHVDVSDNHISSDDEPLDLDGDGDDSEVTVLVTQNEFNSSTGDGIQDLEIDGSRSTVTVVVADNTITADNDGIEDILVDGDRTVASVAILNNTIEAGSDGIMDIEGDNANQTVDVFIAGNQIYASDDGIEDIEVDGTNSIASVTVVNNLIEAGSEGIQDIHADAANQTVDVVIAENDLRAVNEGIEDIEVDGTGTVASIVVANNSIKAESYGIMDIQGRAANQEVDVTIVENDIHAGDDGIEAIDFAGADSVVDVYVAENTINATANEGIDDIDASGENTTARIHVIENDIESISDAIDDILAFDTNQTVELAVERNTFRSSNGDGIGLIEVLDESTLQLTITNNTIDVAGEGIGGLYLAGDDMTTEVVIESNTITTDEWEAVEYIAAYGRNSTVDIHISENVLDAGGSGIGFIDAGDVNQASNVSVVGNEITASADGIASIYTAGEDGAAGIAFVNNTINAGNRGIGYLNPAGSHGVAELFLAENDIAAGHDAVGTITAGTNGSKVRAGAFNNTLTANGTGIDLTAFAEADSRLEFGVSENEITADDGLRVLGGANETEIVVVENTIMDGGTAVRMNRSNDGLTTVAIEGNVIRNNTDGIHLSGNLGDTHVHENVLANNGHAALVNANESGVVVNATRNWWGAMDGPSGDFVGSGDAVLGEVVVRPFYVDAALTTLSSDVPDATPSTRSITFHSVGLDDTATKRFAILNDGSDTLTIADVRIEGAQSAAFDVTVLDGDGSVAPGEGVDVEVSFTPESEGEKTARVVIESNDPLDPVVNVSLSGQGRTAEIDATPESLGFGKVPIDSHRTRNVTITNDGFATLNVTGAIVPDSDAFVVVDGQTGRVVPGDSHVVTVAFDPAVAGPHSATLEISSNDPSDPTVDVALSGTGTVPDVNATTADLAFDDVPTGSSSSRTVTLTNEGNATLVVPLPEVTGPDADAFTVVSPGGTMRIAPGEERDVTVSFGPLETGDAAANLTVESNDPDEPAVDVALAGTGTQSEVTLNRSAIAYGNVEVDSVVTRSFQVRNNGSQSLTLTDVELTGADAAVFEVTAGDDTEVVLQPGEAHQVTVTFTPDATADYTAAVTVTSNDPETPTTNVSLGGTGVVPDVNATPSTVSFDGTRVADERRETVTVANEGNFNLTVEGASITGADVDAFAVDREGPFTVLPGEHRNLTVAFTPDEPGELEANLTIDSNDPDENPLDVTLNGTAVTPDVSVDPEALLYGDVALGDSKELNVSVSNGPDATADITIQRVVVIGSDADAFDASVEPFTLEPNQQRNVTVEFTPQTEGDNKTATLRILTNDPSVPQVDVWLTNSETIVDVDRIDPPKPGEQGVSLNVTNASAGDSVAANVSQPESREANVGVDELSINTTEDVDFDANLTTDDESRSEFNRTNVSTPLKFIRVNQSLDDDQLHNVTFVFRVSKAQLAAEGVPPEDVTLYRLHNGSWNELNVSLIGETRTHYLYRAESPGFSEFASGAKKPDFNVQAASVSVSAVQIGETVHIITRITNAEDAADGTFTVELLLDGSVVDSRDVTIAAGGTRQVTFSRSFGSEGTFTVNVNNAFAGRVEVSSAGGGRFGGSGGGGSGGSGDGPTFTLDEISLSESTIEVGDAVEVTGRIVNHGEDADVFEAVFQVNGVTVDTREVEVPGNETAVITFSRTFDQAGSFELAINGQSAGNVTVEEAANETTPEPASVSVESVSSLPSSIDAGETVTVEATLANPGNVSIEHTAALTVNDVLVAERTVTIPPGETVTVSFERTFEEPGRYELKVDGEPAGTLEVAATPTPTATVRPTTDERSPATTTALADDGIIEQLPGFGPAAALLALVVFVLLMARRRGQV